MEGVVAIVLVEKLHSGYETAVLFHKSINVIDNNDSIGLKCRGRKDFFNVILSVMGRPQKWATPQTEYCDAC